MENKLIADGYMTIISVGLFTKTDALNVSAIVKRQFDAFMEKPLPVNLGNGHVQYGVKGRIKGIYDFDDMFVDIGGFEFYVGKVDASHRKEIINMNSCENCKYECRPSIMYPCKGCFYCKNEHYPNMYEPKQEEKEMKSMQHYKSLVETIGIKTETPVKDCIDVALAIETLAFHNKNFLDRTLTNDCDRSIVIQILLNNALNHIERR